jgi:hypothetical protein
MWLSSSWSWIEHEEVVVKLLIDLYYSCLVSTSVAVVRRTENCHYFLFVTPVVAL